MQTSKKTNKKKRLIYEDELDGVPDYKPECASEEEQEDSNEIEVKRKRKLEPKSIRKTKKSNKRNYKINNNVNFFYFIICN